MKEKADREKEEEINVLDRIEEHEIDCNCCGRSWNSTAGRYLVNGNFICDKCGENCVPTNNQCSITKISRDFSLS